MLFVASDPRATLRERSCQPWGSSSPSWNFSFYPWSRRLGRRQSWHWFSAAFVTERRWCRLWDSSWSSCPFPPFTVIRRKTRPKSLIGSSRASTGPKRV